MTKFIIFFILLFSVFPVNLKAEDKLGGSGKSKNFEHKVYFEKTDYELHVFKINGRIPGPTLMIIGGIQGDEPGGYISADMYADVRLKKGNMIVVPRANFMSIMKEVRLVNSDMNRRFSKREAKIYEDKIVEILKALMAESDFLLNLHEGSGFYDPEHIDSMRNPKRYGQCIIADTDNFYSTKYKKELRLKDMAEKVIKEVNSNVDNPNYRFKFSNHDTASKKTKHSEQRQSATYYALYTLGIPAFGIEVSKSIKDLELKVSMLSMIINAFMGELGITLENPSINVSPPILKYMLLKVNGEFKVISSGESLNVPKGASLEIRHVDSNYTRGINADILGLGNLNDIGKTFVIKKDTKIIVKKDSYVITEIPVQVYDENLAKDKKPSSSILSVTENKENPELKILLIKVNDMTESILSEGVLDLVYGDKIQIKSAVFDPEVDPKDVVINFVGYSGGTDKGAEDDTGLTFVLDDKNLISSFSVKKDLYQIYVKYKWNRVGKFFVRINRPVLRYIIVKDKNSKLEALSLDRIKDSLRLNPVIEDIVLDGLAIEEALIETDCGKFNLADIKSKNLKSIFGCKKKNKEDTRTIYGISRKI
jgi:hypothetical protein